MEPEAALQGLSPPTRGNRNVLPKKPSSRRSIPAHAGEPYPAHRRLPHRRVYPRPRGGTMRATISAGVSKGLSPPTRGNLRAANEEAKAIGSIPAHAGEPSASCGYARRRAVYPRPRGGTPPPFLVARQRGGLSPPTRGNPLQGFALSTNVRSIPAHAGEPADEAARDGADEVYPRPRGGTG